MIGVRLNRALSKHSNMRTEQTHATKGKHTHDLFDTPITCFLAVKGMIHTGTKVIMLLHTATACGSMGQRLSIALLFCNYCATCDSINKDKF